MARHLTLQDRDRIARFHHQGLEQQEIAKILACSKGTISRELRRNATSDGEYLAGHAQEQARRRRRERPISRRMDSPEIDEAVRSGLAQQWSPEQIEGRLKLEHADDPTRCVSAQTIYNWVENDEDREHWKGFLRRRGKRPNRRKKTGPADGAKIANRPEIIEQRLRLGDFEGDTVLGPPGTGGLATLVDRKSRMTIIVKIQSKDADHVHARLKQRLKQLDEERRHSITFDNGTEFARCYRLEKHLGIQLYFAEPGCPYQRGTNENTNGLIRQYFPKGTEFREISHHEIREVENLLNTRPRECLGFRTPYEVFFEENASSSCD